jgi:hypothetical protein
LSKEDIGGSRAIRRTFVPKLWTHSAHVQWYAVRVDCRSHRSPFAPRMLPCFVRQPTCPDELVRHALGPCSHSAQGCV